MIWYEIKLIIRKIFFNKTFSTINIIGLTIGLIVTIVAFLYVQDELRVNKHFKNTRDIYRLTINNDRARTFHSTQPALFFDEIIGNIPEIQSGVRILNSNAIMQFENNTFKADFIYADSNFFQFFGWGLVSGNPDNVLSAPLSIVISESKAKQLFKEINPIGKLIKLENAYNYTITGIFKDIPTQSTIRTDFFASLITIKNLPTYAYYSWGWHGLEMYFKVPGNTNMGSVNKKIALLWNEKSNDYSCSGDFVHAKLQPFPDIYLKSGYLQNSPNNLDYLLGFAIIAAFILIISCFNFINLFIALNSKRSAETGIKKVLGADWKVFTRTILLEILLYLIIAVTISSFVVKLILPYFNKLIGSNYSFLITNNLPLFCFLLILCFFVLVITAIFPILQMVYINTAGLLKASIIVVSNKTIRSLTLGNYRNILVIIQFTFGIMLILSSILVNMQLRLIRQRDIGFDREQVIIIDNSNGDAINRFEKLKNILLKYPEIQTITCGQRVPASGINNWGGLMIAGDENDNIQTCGYVSIHDQYFKAISAETILGRNFNETLITDKNKVIINEALMKALGLKDPIGIRLTKFWDDKEREIIGVVKNIEYFTIHYPNIPIAYLYMDPRFGDYYQNIILKLKSENLSKTISGIKENWDKISPEYPMDYYFLDEQFNTNYAKETHIGFLINVMTLIAIFLCCMGLYGLALFNINSRIKEIGVRKVNGAKTFEIISLINKDFIIWILSAYLIAIPVSSYFILNWLDNFAQKTSFPWWTVLLTGVIAVGVALLTVSWQSFRAAARNPVKSLRYE
jgi:putative ABC transport system permease protein